MVAVKRIKIDDCERQSRRKKVQNEVTTLRARKNPHIVPLLASFIAIVKEETWLHLLLPYAEGGDLEHWMMSDSIPENPPSLTEGPSLIRDFIYESILTIVSALAYVHSDRDGQWTGHYDIKPANVLLFNQYGKWVWKLSDFGHSNLKLVGTRPGKGRHIGTLDYQPPEYWNALTRAEVYLSFDVFAMGCIVIQLATLIAYPQWDKNQVKAFHELRGDSELQPNLSKNHPFGQNKYKVDNWIGKLKQAYGNTKFRKLLDTGAAMLNNDPNQRLLAFDAALDIWALCNPEHTDESLAEFQRQCNLLTEGQGRSPKFGDCYDPIDREREFAAIHGPERAQIRTTSLAARSWHKPRTYHVDDDYVSTGRTSKSLTNMPRTYRETTLYGRERQLSSIGFYFENTHRVSLVGLGGIGKSHLAWWYASELSRREKQSGKTMHTFWLQAQNQSVLEASYMALGRKLGITGNNIEACLVGIKDWLENEEHGSWLMVFDSVDEGCADLSKYCPWHLNKVLITTKDRNVALRYCDDDFIIELSALDPQDGVKILKDRVKNFSVNDEEPAKALASMLHFPLYIELIGAHICQHAGTDISINSMHQCFAENKRTLAKDTARTHKRKPGFQGPMTEEKFTFFDIVFEPLKKRYRRYCGAFRLMCLFSRNEIDIRLHQENFKGNETEIIAALSNLYLIKKAAKHCYSVHSLVQTMFLAWVEEEQGLNNIWNGRLRALTILRAKYNKDKAEALESAKTSVKSFTPLHLMKLRAQIHVEDFVLFLKEYSDIKGPFKLSSARAVVVFARMFRDENRFEDAVLLLNKVIELEISDRGSTPAESATFEQDASEVKLQARRALIETRFVSASGRTGFDQLEKALKDADYAIQEAAAANNPYMKHRLSALRIEVLVESLTYEGAGFDSSKYDKVKQLRRELEAESALEPTEACKQQLNLCAIEAACYRYEGDAKSDLQLLESSRNSWQKHYNMILETTYTQQEKEEKRNQTQRRYLDVCLVILTVLTQNSFKSDLNEQYIAEIGQRAREHAWVISMKVLANTEEKYSQEAPKLSRHKHVLDAELQTVGVRLRIGRWERNNKQIESCVKDFQSLLQEYRKRLPKSDKDVRRCAYFLRECLRWQIQHEGYDADYLSTVETLERDYGMVPYLLEHE